ncbi:MAG: hypothetical protein J7521_09260 [Caulobacter sp.]|nr:hypothetical protein [Caulobacter sp.]
MQALPRPQPPSSEHSAEIVPFEALNLVRSIRALDRAPPPPQEAHPWAYCFPRPGPES